MDNISDDELFLLASEENEEAKNILFNKYKYIIDILMKKYGKVAYQLGIEQKDLYAEGLYGFSDALVCYSQDKPASIGTFITLCVERRIKSQLLRAGRIKNKINLEAYSLDYIYEHFGVPLSEVIQDENECDPLHTIASSESYHELLDIIHEALSDFEYTVFSFIVNDFDYVQIATMLDKSPKQIDNTMQRMKLKVKKILNDRQIT
ncbi:MAG: hypothetical protein K2M17_02240 [Bacilli bacterium]|nr:hypothetical protein [Bacilli bacterium]